MPEVTDEKPVVLRCGANRISFDRPRIMGILNVTPDSFSDGGRYADIPGAVSRAREMVEQGADLIDVGGESTRPGASPVDPEEECRRILPVIERLVSDGSVPISVDTRHPQVMRAAIQAGATLINDIEALGSDAAMDCALSHDVAVCLMHMHGQPATMQQLTHYPQGVEYEVGKFLVERARHLEHLGVDRERLLIDPGFGFAKNRHQNIELMNFLPELTRYGYAVLVGLSRKSLLVEQPWSTPPSERLGASVAAMMWAIQAGVKIVRVHDVAESRQAIDLYQRLIHV
ncbi:MAG: dihydropteroate synthase [Betaproteobacteria bacterium]|nr:dihydropteroate synthase [Betaproteobacteria bacterium]